MSLQQVSSSDSFDPEGDAVERQRLRPVRQLSSNSIQLLYEEVGYLLNDFEKPVLLADALVPDCPIVGASDTFVQLSGYTREEILGKNCRFLLKDVPECSISRSGRKNLRSMIRMCRLIGLSSMGSTSCCQTNRTHNGETFVNMFAVGLVMLHDQPFLLGVSSACTNKASKEQLLQVRQEQQALIAQIRVLMEDGIAGKVRTPSKSVLARKAPDFVCPRARKLSDCNGARAFFSGALTERVILLNNRCTVMRREPLEIPNGCVVVSDRPLRRTRQGLFFAVRLEGVLQGGWNNSWPMLGMTQVSPDEIMTHGYPKRGEWCGRSICIGGEFQAWCRENETHKFFGEAKGAQKSRVWDGPRPRWQGRTTTPWELDEGDVMGMLYEPNGHVHLMVNYKTVLSIDTGKPMDDGPFYALVDCQGQAYELTLLPHELPSVGCVHELSMQPLISHKVVDFAARAAAGRAASSCTFSVSIADPSQPDVPLVAVSPAFEEMTGYSCEEVVGKNCRFLNHDCETNFNQRFELRRSCQTGRPFSSLLQNRTKSGDIFWNLLDLRGLKVAKDIVTGEDVWFLVGIQSNVSKLLEQSSMSSDAAEEIQDAHKRELEEVAKYLRQELQRECGELAVASLPMLVQGPDRSKETDSGNTLVEVPAAEGIEQGPKPDQQPMIALLPEPSWMTYDEEEEGSQASKLVQAMTEKPCNAAGASLQKLSQICLPLATKVLDQTRTNSSIFGAFAFGLASIMLCRLYCKHHQRAPLNSSCLLC